MEKVNSKSLIDDAIFSFSIGEEEKAKLKLKKVLDLEPENLDALRAISEVLLSLEELELSEFYCRRALEINSDDLTSMVSLARILVKKGDKDGAEDASAKARILGWKEELSSDSDQVQ
jgi:tetratricopeptide (TPR) repeat protein